MSQERQILEKLNRGGWTCSSELIEGWTVDYRSRINGLRKKGYNIISRTCKGCGRNHKARMNQWYLEFKSRNEIEARQIAKEIPFCCESGGIFKDKFGQPIHSQECLKIKEKVQTLL